MDIRNYTWVDTLEVEGTNNLNPAGTSGNNNNNHDKTKIVIEIGGIIGGISLIMIGLFGIKWYKKGNNIHKMKFLILPVQM
jgi:hypothetical protein